MYWRCLDTLDAGCFSSLMNAPDLDGSMIVSGIFFHIALQVILNICVVINLIPTTGITLPFVSYGGTLDPLSYDRNGNCPERIKTDKI